MNSPTEVEPTAVSIEIFLELDRQALLGRLSGGLVHAINNVLSAVIGQVDLLLISNPGDRLKADLEQIATNCDEGVILTKSLNRVITSLKPEAIAEPRVTLDALLALLSRIFRRAGVEAKVTGPSMIRPIKNGEWFTQAIFHLLMGAFESLSVDTFEIRTLNCSLIEEGEGVRIELSSTAKLIDASSEGAGELSHGWILSRLCEKRGGSWGISEEGQRLFLLWV